MMINEHKSAIVGHWLDIKEVGFLSQHFPFGFRDLDEGLKYLGFL